MSLESLDILQKMVWRCAGAAAPAGSSCSGLQMALVALLLAALAIYFVPYPYCLLLCYAAYLLEALCFNATAKGLWRLKQTESLLRYIEEMKDRQNGSTL